MVDRLIDILSREAVLLESFLDLLEQQKRALVANDLTALTAVTERQRELHSQSVLLNRQREETIAEIKVTEAVNGDLSVIRLVEMVDKDRANRLLALRETILSLSEKITDTRNANALMINKSREFITKMMSTLSRINNPEPAYSAKPSKQPAGAVMVDRSA
jgi:flagellar biosynthesis/type III secretory pathway chaperone